MMDHNYALKKLIPPKNCRNTKYCCVPQCGTYGGQGISFHLFPKNKSMKTQWEIALRMGKPASTTMTVCSRHFITSDYFRNNSVKHKLFPHAIPSRNIPKRTHDKKEASPKKQQRLAREYRAELRQRCSLTTKQYITADVKSEEIQDTETRSTSDENYNEYAQPFIKNNYCMTTSVQVNLADFRKNRPQEGRGLADILSDEVSLEKCTQVNWLPEWKEVPGLIAKVLTLSDLLINDEYLFAFTGVHSITLLEGLVSCTEELALNASTNKKILSVRDRIILTMVKIKQNMSFTAIGVLFGINRQTCTNYFKNMCPMLARVLKVMIPWPDQEMIRLNLPISFKNYKNTRIILDCAETIIEKCKCLKCRILTYSQYKKSHTAKFNIGVTPSGLVTEISTPYGGRASDKHIVNQSGILDKCDFNDGVMVDKGYRIETECLERYLQLIRPPFLEQKKQMSREDALRTAEIARARVHVERVIQRLRQYEFLCGPIPWTLAPYFEDILTIVGGLTNLGSPVMNIDKFM